MDTTDSLIRLVGKLDGITSIVEPETILPSQFFEQPRLTLTRGELRLMAAMLEDAVRCYMKYAGSAKGEELTLFREADEWLMLDDKKWIFSCANICDMLGINLEYLRRGLRAWLKKTLHPSPINISPTTHSAFTTE